MAAYDFYTTADVALLLHPRKPSYPVEAAPTKNVVHSTSVGGKVRAQVRGSDRRRLTLRWPRITAAHLGQLLAWHASYGGMRQPFTVELPANLTDLPGGTKLRVRNPQVELEYAQIVADRYEVHVELIEDLV